MNIKEIESAISALPQDEFEALRLWFAGFIGESRRRKSEIGCDRSSPPRRKEPQQRKSPSESGARHRRTDHFRICYRQLTEAIRTQVDSCFELINQDSSAPSLQFQKDGLIWSMNIGADHKALALEASGKFLWYWVGSREACYNQTK